MPTDPLYRFFNSARDIPRSAQLLSQAFGGTLEQAQRFLGSGSASAVRVMAADEHAPPDACAVIPDIGQYFGGRLVSMIGVAGVAVAPEARGSGLGGRLMRQLVLDMHEQGAATSALYPATQPIYRSVGYEQAGSTFEHKLLLRELRIPREWGETPMRPALESDRPAIESAYLTHAIRSDGALARHTHIWPRVYTPRGEPAHGFIVGQVSGPIEGWVFYKTDEPFSGQAINQGRTVNIVDIQALTPRAAKRLLAFFAGFASIYNELKLQGGPFHPITFLLPEQRFRVSLADHWMLRLLCVEKALTQRGYAAGLRASVTFDVRDPLIQANQGAYTLRVEQGRGDVVRGGAAAPSGVIRCDIRELASMYSGFASPTQLASIGAIEGPPDALQTAASLFAGQHPAIPTPF